MSDARQTELVQVGTPQAGGVSRREALQWVMAAVAASAAPVPAFGQRASRRGDGGAAGSAKPYGTDPNLMKDYKPGDLWPLTFNDAQRRTAIVLADLIIPHDQYGPAASKVGVPAMIDEWISAPYPEQQSHRPIVLDGLAWMDAESNRRFGKPFADLAADQHRAICDDICYTGSAKPALLKPAEFFQLFRSLCASAYYATPQGWTAIGYVGNVALTSFDGPPAEVLVRLGVEQTVK